MGIHKKIEEIRQKPEHQRVRYVWMAVAICMFFLVILWIFSVKDLFNRENQSISDSKSLTEIVTTDKKVENNSK